MKKTSKIYVAGHRGLVGAAIIRRLEKAGYENLILRTHQQMNLTHQTSVEAFFKKEKPEYVFYGGRKGRGHFGKFYLSC